MLQLNFSKRGKFNLFASFSLANPQFVDTGHPSWKLNPGRTANYYHKVFSEKMERDTLKDLFWLSQQKGAHLDMNSNGFHDRNNKIVLCDYLIAFSWSTGSRPEDGGTNYTWSKCQGVKILVLPYLISPSDTLIKDKNIDPNTQEPDVVKRSKKRTIEEDNTNDGNNQDDTLAELKKARFSTKQ
jgi:hypothetical protein